MRVTIADIAKRLNLANSTVSRALKDDSRISVEVRKTVKNLAHEMGYRPNLLARSLVSDKTYSIGLVINDISWSFFSELSQHIQNASERYGYSMFLYSSGDDPKKEMAGIDSIIARRSDGLIIYAHEYIENIRQLEQISKHGFPVVMLNNLENLALDVVTVDNLKGTYQAMEYLYGLGHRRIAYVGPKPVKSVERERLSGYENFMKEKFGTIDRNLVYTGKAYALFGYDATKEILCKEPRPTAIAAYNDIMALGVNRAILEAGLKIPGDISVMGSDGLDICLTAYPPLTTISSPFKQMANTAVDMLVHRIEMQAAESNGSVFSPQNIKLVPQLMIRDSTGKAAQTP
jgi:DNA-binding LacI/PurR family transcriptional regulator